MRPPEEAVKAAAVPLPVPAIDPAKTSVAAARKHSSPLLSCRFDPRGRFLFAGAQDRGVLRWKLDGGDPGKSPEGKKAEPPAATPFLGHTSWVRAIAFHPGGETMVTGGYDGKLLWWQTATEKPVPLRTIEAHRGWVRALAASPDGRLLASCGNDGLVKVWSLEGGELLASLEGHGCHVYNVAFHPGGKALASADLLGKVREWDIPAPGGAWKSQCARQLDAGVLHKFDAGFQADIGGARSIGFSPDGRLFACGGITDVSNAFAGVGRPMAVLFDWEKGEVKQKHLAKENYNGALWGLAFHPAGILIGASGGNGGGFILFWKSDKAEEIFQLKLPDTARDLHLHPDGLRLATAHFDGHVRISTLSA